MRILAALRRSIAALMLLPAAVITACSGDSPGGPDATPAIAISLAPTSVNANAGGTGTSTITIARSGGFNGAVALSLQDAPTGVTGAFVPAAVAAGGTSSTLTLTLAPTTAVGSHNMSVRATGTGVSAVTTALTLSVQPMPRITVAVIPSTITLAQGANGTATIQIGRTNFAGDVALAVTGAPAGLTATITPTPTTGNSGTIALAVGAAVTPGTHPLTLTGSGSGIADAIATLMVTVTATPPASMALEMNPGTLTVAQGGAGTSTISIVRTNFTHAVGLTVSGMPAGVTATIDPASTTTNTSTVTVNAGAATTAGTYPLTITGQATGVSNATATLNLVVTAPQIWAQVSAGVNHSCGLTMAGAAYCWGYNGNGELGTGDQVNQTRPVPVLGGFTWTAISAGEAHTCAIATTGTAYCWGYGAAGQLGNGSTTAAQTSPVPVSVSGGDTWASISAGAVHTCGITPDGRAYCWGDDFFGQLGNGAPEGQTTRMLVTGGRTWRTISANGGIVYPGHTCGVTTGNEAFCWGANHAGQLGQGGVGGVEQTPVAVSGGRAWSRVTTGDAYSCGVTTVGDGYCWGDNGSGQLGIGSNTGQSLPTLVLNDHKYLEINTGTGTTCGVTTARTAYCWGSNGWGQAGTGTSGGNQASPALVTGGFLWTTVDTGSGHNCGRTETGQAYCWGLGGEGQLGAGSITQVASPTRVSNPPD